MWKRRLGLVIIEEETPVLVHENQFLCMVKTWPPMFSVYLLAAGTVNFYDEFVSNQ